MDLGDFLGLAFFICFCGLCLFLLFKGLNTYRKLKQAYLSLPTLKKYLSLHPDCKSRKGPICFHCGSSYTWRTWVSTGFYKHSCKGCGETLFRSSAHDFE